MIEPGGTGRVAGDEPPPYLVEGAITVPIEPGRAAEDQPPPYPFGDAVVVRWFDAPGVRQYSGSRVGPGAAGTAPRAPPHDEEMLWLR
jgi:hypothetical protein